MASLSCVLALVVCCAVGVFGQPSGYKPPTYPSPSYPTTYKPPTYPSPSYTTTYKPTTSYPSYPTTYTPTTSYPSYPTTYKPTTSYPSYPTTYTPTTSYPSSSYPADNYKPTTSYPSSSYPADYKPTTSYPSYPTTYKPTTSYPSSSYPSDYKPTTSYPSYPTTYKPTTSYPSYTTTYKPDYKPYDSYPSNPSYPAGYGGQNYNAGYQGQPSYPVNNYNGKNDELDLLYARLEAAIERLKFYEEEYQALVASLSLQRRFLDEFNKLTLVNLRNIDNEQDKLIYGLLETAEKASYELQNELTPKVYELSALNRNNTEAAKHVGFEIATAVARDVQQDGDIFRIYDLLKLLKYDLLQVSSNDFQVFYDAVARVSNRLTSSEAYEARRTCEVGQVTLGADDLFETRRVEYQFQTVFDDIPGILYGICGFDFELEAKRRYASKYGSSYAGNYGSSYAGNYGSSYAGNYGSGYAGSYGGSSSYSNYGKGPNTLGFNILAFPTATGIHFRLVERSFGSTATESVDVCFQACSIGPGRDSYYSKSYY